MKALYIFTISSLLVLGCGQHKPIIETEGCADDWICCFESDQSKWLVCEGKKLILMVLYNNKCVKSRGEVEYCFIEDVSYVDVGGLPVRKINQRISVSYNGEYSSYFSNGKLESIGRYKHGDYAGEWRRYSEEGFLIEKVKY